MAARSRWNCSGLRGDVPIHRLDVLLAADRPDRLEVEISAGDFRLGRGGGPAAPAAGQALELSTPEGVLFRGRLESRFLELESGARIERLVAYAEYETRRRGMAEATYWELTDSEIAERVAWELGLEAVVDATSEVHACVPMRGDPMRFLRARARAIDFRVAVARGRLYFTKALPPPDPAAAGLRARRLPFDGSLRSFEVEEASDGRSGSFEVDGDPVWRPLISFEVDGVGKPWDGRYRVWRALHLSDARAYRTRVEFVEESATRALERSDA